MNNNLKYKKVLVAPLDWGLGHATRCQVIIQFLLDNNCEVYIAAASKTKALLQKEFPTLSFLNLPGYNILYSKSKRSLPVKILLQIPKIFKIIQYEHNWLKQVLHQHQFDAVISDNRYGFYSKTVPSIFITHQLNIKTNIDWFDKILQHINYKYINRFGECWIPDFPEDPNIAGELSHPKRYPDVPVKYIGILSRFRQSTDQTVKNKWLAIISGPEPQRTLFEKRIFNAASTINENFIIVRGLPGTEEHNLNTADCKVFNHLPASEMQKLINESEFIISRCGYTTVMELLSLQKKSILIPTPGQTEQEYLAQHLSKQKWCYSFKQGDDFSSHLKNAKLFDYDLPKLDTEQYQSTLKNLIENLLPQ